VVGPVCESSDFLAQGRRLPPIEPGDLLAVFCAGAYGMSMSMNYNDHPRPAEVLVDGGECRLIRPRQKEVDLIASELNPGGR
jgi:diaminopimelate decarboxylase